MEIVYAAHTQSGVFMLDEQGVCRWAVAHPGRTAEKVPERIVGAQYLATLDLHAEGALVDFPRVGCPMLFAATDETGRIRLVRTPPLLRFEDRRNAPTRRPLASKFDIDASEGPTPRSPRARYDDELTPVASSLMRSSSIPPEPTTERTSSIPPAPASMRMERAPMSSSTPPLPESAFPVPLLRPAPPRTPLPPPPRARIAARIPPPPTVPSLASTGSGLRASPSVQSIPVRVRSANMSLRKRARGQ